MASASTVKWVTDDGLDGSPVTVTVTETVQYSHLRWVTDDGLDGGVVVVTVDGEEDPNPTSKTSTVKWVTDDGFDGGPVVVTAEAESTSSTVKWVTDDGLDGSSVTVKVFKVSGTNVISGSGTLAATGSKSIAGNGALDWYGEVTGSGKWTARTVVLPEARLNTAAFRPIVENTHIQRVATTAELTFTTLRAEIDPSQVRRTAPTIRLDLQVQPVQQAAGSTSRTLPRAEVRIGIYQHATTAKSKPLLFRPPTVDEATDAGKLLSRYELARGVTVLREGGVYREVRYPTSEEIAAAERAYLGGHLHELTPEEVVELRAAGYGAFISSTWT